MATFRVESNVYSEPYVQRRLPTINFVGRLTNIIYPGSSSSKTKDLLHPLSALKESNYILIVYTLNKKYKL